uniref:Uncharacterized protein n=1 Tax=viral metagenome TaxID=1070528 RepID=A0A6M3Y1N7_9ZZZZ
MSPDISMCSNKQCKKECYRRLARPDTYQSYSKFTVKNGRCKDFMACSFIPIISTIEYQKKMNKIIKKGKPVSDTLIEMLDEAGKYEIKEKSK